MRPFAVRLIGIVLVALACDDLAGPTWPPLTIVSGSLPRALPGSGYAATLEASGGDERYTWSLAAGSGALPPGLVLGSTGIIAGTAAADGAFGFTVRVASGDGQSVEAALSILVPPLLAPDDQCSDYPAHAIATFEDPEVEGLVRIWASSDLGADEDADLTCALLSGLTRLGNGSLEPEIESLAGMQNLTGLTSLDLGGAATLTFTDLSPLRDLTSLTRLGLTGGSITDIGPLAGLTNLTELALSGNSITDISPVAGLTALERLYLSHNLVSDISPLAGLTNLELLWIGRGAINYLGLFDVPVRGDPITDIGPLSGLSSLTQLWIHGQAITDLGPLAGLANLTGLLAYNNDIADISGLATLTGLTSLSLDSNAITDVGPLAGLTELRGLTLGDNAIIGVGPLSGLAALQHLRLSENSISDLDPLASLANLGYLELANNQIVDVGPVEGLIELDELDLDGNAGLSDIQPLLDNPGLGPPRPNQAPNYNYIFLRGTAVSCEDVAALEARGARVTSDCS